MLEDKIYSLDELISAVNAWSDDRGLRPANGQSAGQLSLRTLRYYRTMGLLAAPISGGGQGYGEIHRLQLSAIRVLQAQGLPLRRIQVLLYGRTEAELRTVLQKGAAAAPAQETFPALPTPEDWRMVPLDSSIMLILRPGRSLTSDQISRIHAIINDSSVQSSSKP
ncbi:MAG TPA: MerR family transcriptional regulator [Candidatus Methylacidiphilales bacterium]